MNSLSSKTLRLSGEINLAGDKSLSHRAALFAALAPGKNIIRGFLVSGVTRAMLNCLEKLGVPFTLDGDTLIVDGGHLTPPIEPLYCGNSATTIRMLAGAMAYAGIPCTLDGSDGLRKRPMNRICEPLRQMGVQIAGDTAPLVLEKRTSPLLASRIVLPVASAQVKSCLILAALAADGDTVISEPGPSRDHTERMLASMGADIRCSGNTVVVSPLNRPLSPLDLTLPGDISSAAFLIVAALITSDSDILIRRVGLNPTRTGILDALRQMGGRITIENEADAAGEPIGDIRVKSSALKAISVSGDLVVRMIDEFPVFAVAAACAEGTTFVHEAQELRFKETDRIEVLCRNLTAVGIPNESYPDGFAVTGAPFSGGKVRAAGDHRFAMAFAVAGLASAKPIVVEGAEIADESFPGFIPLLNTLGAQIKGE